MDKIPAEVFAVWVDTLREHNYSFSRKGMLAKRKIDRNTTHCMSLSLSNWGIHGMRVQPATIFYFFPATRLLAEIAQVRGPRDPLFAPGFYDLTSENQNPISPFLLGELTRDVEKMQEILDHYTSVIDPWLWSLADPETLVREAISRGNTDSAKFYSASAAAAALSRKDLLLELLPLKADVLSSSEKVNPNPVLRNWIAYLEKLCQQ